jgi:predicted GIY-YIG superfamily endonuclease
MKQMLLLPDPRPLVERLGAEFFRQAPQSPGVYLMRDEADAVLYVGKARNLRQRLASYRVANPDHVPRRRLRLLRAVRRIELQECAHEQAALARESELLRHLRPRFNRAGTWPGTPRYLGWRKSEAALELTVAEVIDPSWQHQGPLGAGALPLRAALARLLWCALYPDRGLAGLPQGWFAGRHTETTTIPCPAGALTGLEDAGACLEALFTGHAERFTEWVRERTCSQNHPFEAAVREADTETVNEFAQRWFRQE